jgi:hypothetical protein
VKVKVHERIMHMFKTYRTTNETIIGEEAENADITLILITDVDGNEYVMVKTQEEKAIYNISLIGHVTEIVQDVLFEEFKKITYARLDKIKHH